MSAADELPRVCGGSIPTQGCSHASSEEVRERGEADWPARRGQPGHVARLVQAGRDRRREAPATTTADGKRIKELEREVKELIRANEILLAASSFFSTGDCRGSAAPRRAQGPVRVEPICWVLSTHGVKIAPSTCYARPTRLPSPRALRDDQPGAEIERVHRDRQLGRGLAGSARCGGCCAATHRSPSSSGRWPPHGGAANARSRPAAPGAASNS
jgi:hypothetical protein